MPFFRFFRKPKPKQRPPVPGLKATRTRTTPPAQTLGRAQSTGLDIRRFFHNEHNFQCYTTWFAHWGGWISAGHCLTEAQDHLPSFTSASSFEKWPDGLDAALVGCTLPASRPADPVIGQEVIIQGYPAGSRNLEERTGRVFFERSPGQWITHIFEPDEPVVTRFN